MAKHLKPITRSLNDYLNARFNQRWQVPTGINLAATDELPAPLFVARHRGEALLKQCFFTALDQKHITDPASQQYAWQHIIGSGHVLQEVIETGGAAAFFPLHTGDDYNQQCYNVYCILLWDAAQHHKGLEAKLGAGLINHYLATLYPQQAKGKSPEDYKKDIARQLAKQWHQRPVIKESFNTEGEEVSFALLAKLPRHSATTLVRLKGKRLKSTRLAAYKQCLQRLEQESIALPAALTSRKQDPMQGLDDQ